MFKFSQKKPEYNVPIVLLTIIQGNNGIKRECGIVRLVNVSPRNGKSLSMDYFIYDDGEEIMCDIGYYDDDEMYWQYVPVFDLERKLCKELNIPVRTIPN